MRHGVYEGGDVPLVVLAMNILSEGNLHLEAIEHRSTATTKPYQALPSSDVFLSGS